MKKFARIISIILCLLTILPYITFGYSTSIEENDPVDMPRCSPLIDGTIEEEYWSDPAYLNGPTAGHFWGSNDLTSEAKLYFAYDDTGLYFAADITDNDQLSGFTYCTGYDDINNSGSTRPYGFNGDVLTLMLDPLGVYEQKTYPYTVWYNVGLFEDGSIRVYRSRVNEGEITSSCTAAGSVTENGWKFELFIPWSVIISDSNAISSSKITVTNDELIAPDAVSRASVMYMDRADGDTWGRFITVCEKTYDGYDGCVTNGTSPKTYGLKLVNGASRHMHVWSDYTVVTPATCTETGLKQRACERCSAVETAQIPATGHLITYTSVVTPATCTEDGVSVRKCSACQTVISYSKIYATGHSYGEWYVVTAATQTTHGVSRRDCSVCGDYEEKIIPASNAPTITTDGYKVSISNAENIYHIRYAKGVLTTTNSIKYAEDVVSLNTKYITANTFDGMCVREMSTDGTYSFWIKMNDGTTYILMAELSDIEPYATSDGVKITLNDLCNVRDVTIAKGEYDTYRNITDNKIAQISSARIDDSHTYTYTVYEPGIHSICVRYNDTSREYTIIHINLTVTEPEFTPNGLQLTISNLDGVKVIRTAYGDYSTSGDIKRAEGARNFTAKSAIKGDDSYTIQYRENSLVSVSVEYNNGYCKIYQFNSCKKEPGITYDDSSVTLTNLEDLYVIRYAEGTYTTANEVKNAQGSKYIRPSAVVDDKVVITNLKKDRIYTFLVQYKEQSVNVFTITPGQYEYPSDVADISGTLQTMLEGANIDDELTTASLSYITPTKKSSVFTFNKAYEAGDAVYHNIVECPDGGYRMYYKATDGSGIRRICYIESEDGITWTRPTLNVNNYNGEGSNIITEDANRPDNLFVFYDTNPDCPENERWKGIYGQWGDGLFMETSATGTYFSFGSNMVKVMGTPTETEGCFFDTLNTVYWDSTKGKYVAFVRGFHLGDNYNLTKDYVSAHPSTVQRDIRYAESDDCINWTIPVPITYDDGNDWQMYANAIVPYYRDNSLYIGLPTRFVYGATSKTDVFLMSSRNLLSWDRTDTAYMTPNGEGTMYTYGNSGYPCVGFIQTSDTEISMYMKEKSGGYAKLYRYTLRIDGFAKMTGNTGDKIVTNYVKFSGDNMLLNYDTGDNGKIKITITDYKGSSTTTGWFEGNGIDEALSFNRSLINFKDTPVTITIEFDGEADIYSYQFK